MPKMNGYDKTFKVKKEYKKLMSFPIDDKELLEKYKDIWTKIEDLKNIKLNALPAYDDRYIKTEIRTFDDNVYTNFHSLNVLKDDMECESFTDISNASLLVHGKKHCL